MPQIIQEADAWKLSGDLTLSNMPAVLVEADALKLPATLKLDFSRVGEVDTSTISFVLEIKRRMLAHQGRLYVDGVSDNLLSLMQLYGVDAFILV